MKKSNIVAGFLIFILMGTAVVYIANRRFHFVAWPLTSDTQSGDKALYYCPMHPNIQSDKPGECPICHMSLVKKVAADNPAMGHKPARNGAANGKGKLLYYRNPMNPQVTSPVPMKDEMGMDYVPVYEQESNAPSNGIYINTRKQQLIGVKTQKVKLMPLQGEIITVGRVAYDPNLFVAQQEYLQALKSRQIMSKSSFTGSAEQSDAFVETAKRKLMLMGMSEAEIEQLTKSGKAEQSLYLPGSDEKTIWVYLTVYEYEAGLVKAGIPVEVKALAYPGVKFVGKIISIAPILDPITRSLRVRALIENPDQKLKLEMFVNVAIKYDLGEKLAIPDEAVMHTGTKDVVYVADANGYFEARIVELGATVDNFDEVLKGLQPGETVVTSGNFLIDSESKLNAVLNQTSEPNK